MNPNPKPGQRYHYINPYDGEENIVELLKKKPDTVNIWDVAIFNKRYYPGIVVIEAWSMTYGTWTYLAGQDRSKE